MSFLAVLFLAFAMSTDAFAVSICRGASLRATPFFSALKVGLLFGVIETITPLLGWLLGLVALQYIELWDHWVIFIVMFFLGIKMIHNSFQEEVLMDDKADGLKFTKRSFFMFVVTAISTSIDAFAVGVGLALASVNIWFASSMIGLATCIMVTIGLLLGKRIGCMIGKRAEFIGGLVLISIGVITVYQSLFE